MALPYIVDQLSRGLESQPQEQTSNIINLPSTVNTFSDGTYGQVSDVVIKGNTYTNLVKNGNFADGANGWYEFVSLATYSIINGKLRSTAITQTWFGQYIPLVTNHKHYFAFDANAINTAIGSYNVNLFNNFTDSDFAESFGRVAIDAEGKVSIIITPTTGAKGLRFRRSGVTAGDYLEIDNVICIDLTATFGAGNEPTKEQCDAMFPYWFDGTKSTISASRLKSVGKNLFDESKLESVNNHPSLVWDGKVLSLYDYAIQLSYNHSFVKYVRSLLKVGHTYTSTRTVERLSGDSGVFGAVRFYNDTYGSFEVFALGDGDRKITFTVPEDFFEKWGTSPLVIYGTSNGTGERVRISRLQIEEGSTSTPYEPYTESEMYVTAYDENGDVIELRSLPNGTKDEINVTEGKYIQRVGVDETDPGNPTFTRSSIAYLSDGTQVPANTPRFEQGKFSKAIMVEEGTNNLVPSLVAFTLRDLESGNLTVIEDNMVISTCIAEGDTAFAAKSPKVNVTEGEIYTFSFYAKANGLDSLDGRPSASDWRTKINWYDGNNTLIAWDMLTDTALYEDWKRYTITAQAPTGAVKAEVIIGGDAPNFSYVGAKAYFKNIQFEQKPYATSFIDGTRATETLTIPTAGVLNPQEGTIECWVYVDDVVRRNIASNWPTVVIIRKGSSAANWIWLEHNPTGIWVLQIRKEDGTVTGLGSFSNSLTPDGWHYFAIRWNTQEGTAELFHNGVKRISLSNVIFPAEYDRIEIGHRSNGSGDWLNSLIDDIRISSIARSDEEILAAYQSDQPLPVDECTAYKLKFDDNLNKERATPLFYQLAEPVITDLDIPYQPLTAYPSGTIYIEPIVREKAQLYNNGLFIADTNIPIESVDSIQLIDGDTVTEVDLSKVTVNPDKLGVTISDATNGQKYILTYEYPSELSTIPTISFTYRQNIKAVKDGVESGQITQKQELDSLNASIISLNDKAESMKNITHITDEMTGNDLELRDKINEIIQVWR